MLAVSMRAARDAGLPTLRASFDLGRSESDALLATDHWSVHGVSYPWPGELKERTLYWFDGDEFSAVARFEGSLIKLVPTDWGAPTFEIDGIKMLPTAQISPFEDARRKVELVQPRGKRLLDTCGGLGYFAACALAQGAAQVLSFEKNPSVHWLREINPWSPDPAAAECAGRLELREGDVSIEIAELPDASFDAALHDPPRFGIAGELYSQAFYDQLSRVLKPGGRLFHYTGAPNRLTSGRDVPREVARRLEKAGFRAELALDGVFAVKGSSARR